MIEGVKVMKNEDAVIPSPLAVPMKQVITFELVLDALGRFVRLAPHIHTPRTDISGMMSIDVKDSTGKVTGSLSLKFCHTCHEVYYEEMPMAVPIIYIPLLTKKHP